VSTSNILDNLSDAQGRRRAAVALVALGENLAATVLRELGEAQSYALAQAMLELGPVSADEIRRVLAELAGQLNTIHSTSAPGEAFTRAVLSSAFGVPAAGRILEDVTRPEPFAWLADADPDIAGRVLSAEPPATIALALAHLDPKTGAKLLTRLPEATRTQVAIRVAQLDSVDETTVLTVDSALRERVGVSLRAPVRRMQGANTLAGMLTAAPRSAEESVISVLEGQDPNLARMVRAAMFTFDDLAGLPNRDLQKILSQVEIGDLALAVATVKPETRATVEGNLSERARENLTEEISYLQSPRPADVRAAQEKVLEVVRRLESEKAIVLPRAGDDEVDE